MNFNSAYSYMLYPDTFARVCSQGVWQPYKHLTYISKMIAPKIAKGGARIVIQTPPRVGKALHVDTPIMTPRGWVRIVDLKVGDFVYGPDGETTKVLGRTQVWKDRKLWRCYSDGLKGILADEDHLWTVQTCRKKKTWRNRRTGYLANRRSPMPYRLPDTVKHKRRYLYLEEAGVGDTVCIQVERPDGLFLAGKELLVTHNSMFITEWMPLWYLNNFFNKNIMIAAYNHDLASGFGRKIRNHLQFNPALQVRLSADSQAADRFRTTAGGEVFAQGVGGSFTGRGAHLFIVDDPFKDWKEASSEMNRKHIANWWDAVADTRLEPGASVIIVNTRWHQADLAGHVISKGGWDVIDMPALCIDPNVDPLKRKVGEALCPERFDREHYLDKQRNSPDIIWNALYQQRPTPPGGTIVQRDWLMFYEKLPPVFDRIVQSWDCTFKDSENSDFVVGQVWGVRKKNYYLIHQIRKRLSFTNTLNEMEYMHRMFPDTTCVLIEEKANGSAIINMLDGKIPFLKPINPTDSKASRLHAVAPIYQQRRVHYPLSARASWIDVHVEELINFGGAPFMDTVDAATQALSELVENSSDRLESLTLW